MDGEGAESHTSRASAPARGGTPARALTRRPRVPEGGPLYVRCHDEEWGVPLRDDGRILEFPAMESFQAGLSWKTK